MLLLQLCTLLLTFKGLEGLNNSQYCLKLPDKIVKSPIILKVKIKSKFNGQNVIETNVKVLKIFKQSKCHRDNNMVFSRIFVIKL